MSSNNQKKLEKFKKFLTSRNQKRGKINWEIKEDRLEFLSQVEPIISDWDVHLPNLLDFFRPEQIESLLLDSTSSQYGYSFIEFVARTGYKDEPKVDQDGKFVLRRTTPLHHANSSNCCHSCAQDSVHELFEIYNRYDLNYTNESGLTHLHVACEFGCDEAVQNFLELGQDPNCLVSETGDSPLHLALRLNRDSNRIVRLLLRYGADPNLANAEGSTPLHVVSTKRKYTCAKMLFERSNNKYHPVQVDARDKSGDTPLMLALEWDNKRMAELFLRKGADPNLANNKGCSPVHIAGCKYSGDLLDLFFKINNEIQQKVQVDARDKLGRTPLQLAVANLMLDAVDVLLDNGADLSSFISTPVSYFEANRRPLETACHFKLRLASGVLGVADIFEKRGHEIDQSSALMIMKFFDEHELFEKPVGPVYSWYDDEKFRSRAKKILIRDDDPSLSLDDLIRLRSNDAAKLLTYSDYHELACSSKFRKLLKTHKEACTMHLCEKISRGFFWCWTLDPFWKLMRCRFPIECCETIMKKLKNEDLCNIFLAATSRESEGSEKNTITNAKECPKERPVRAKKAPARLQYK